MECLSCLSISGERRISPGPIIYQGSHWLVDHAYPTSMLGWLVIVLKRHAEALHELSQDEFVELAGIQHSLAQAMRQDAGVEKEYMACFAESVGFKHIHVHFVARPHDLAGELKGPQVFEALRVDAAHAVPAEQIRAYCETIRERLISL